MSERGHHVTASNQQFANFLYENELITDTSHLTTTDVARALGMMARNVSVNTSNPADGSASEETWNVGVFVSTLMDIVRRLSLVGSGARITHKRMCSNRP